MALRMAPMSYMLALAVATASIGLIRLRCGKRKAAADSDGPDPLPVHGFARTRIIHPGAKLLRKYIRQESAARFAAAFSAIGGSGGKRCKSMLRQLVCICAACSFAPP